VVCLKPTEFLWGAATSSHQIEGNNLHNDWWAWEESGQIEGGARSGVATDHWNRFREDLSLASDLGLNAYRFSIEWSRLEPRQGEWDMAAFARYREILDECRRRGLEPMLTLHHFTSPKWFTDKGGFTGEDAPNHFSSYVQKVIHELGHDVRLWCTFNEPMVMAVGAYLGCFMPPATYSPTLAAMTCRNLLRCHVAAYDMLHAAFPNRIAVGIAHNMLDFKPDRIWHPIERVMSGLFVRFYNRSWLNAVTGSRQNFYVPGLIPRVPVVKEAQGRRTTDFIGVNYYTKAYVQWKPRDAEGSRPAELPLGLAFARRKEPVSDVGWAIHPRGFERVLKLAASYGVPLYVTENGIADRDDKLRPDFLMSHLRVCDSMRRDGVDIRGYFHWSLMDNFEWIKGFGPRFGLYKVDYQTLVRTRTRSAELYKDYIAKQKSVP